jgi:hypothetical protein
MASDKRTSKDRRKNDRREQSIRVTFEERRDNQRRSGKDRRKKES